MTLKPSNTFFESGLFKWRRTLVEHHGIHVVALDFYQSLYTAENSCSGYKSQSLSLRFALFFGNFKHCSIVSCAGSELARDLADLFMLWDFFLIVFSQATNYTSGYQCLQVSTEQIKSG